MKKREEKKSPYDENLRLLSEYRSGNEEAGERLALLNAPLVYSIAGRFTSRGADISDLVESGNIGLVKAMKTFDFSRECAFSTYAVPKISGEIRRFLRDDGAVKVSRGLKEQSAAIKGMRSKLTALFGREPTIQEIADQLGLSPEEIAIAETATAATESIQQENGEDGFTLENVLTDTESEEKMVEKIAVRQVVESLPEREKMVIQLRYYHGLTQQRVAKVMNVSQVQVSRIEKKALEKLREFMQ